MNYLEINEKLISKMKEYLNYDPETGLFTWIKTTSRRVKVGDVAGRVSNSGHLGISFMGSRYQAHRLAWGFTYGYVPNDLEIDHQDEDKLNNRIDNLRLANRPQNSANRGKPVSNSSGFKGVSFNKLSGKGEAYITHLRKRVYLGLYNSPEEAFSIVNLKRQEFHADFYNDGE